MTIVCRTEEVQVLNELLKSSRAELLVIFGRRRIGKTFLIREFFQTKSVIFFNVTGIKDGGFHDQLQHFCTVIADTFYQGAPIRPQVNWYDAFTLLNNSLKNLPKNKKVVLFFDELPWMATPRAKLLQTLDLFWNQYWVQDKHIKVILCGSSASWIIDNIVNNKGGLHNRITSKIFLSPFNLQETKEFLTHHNIALNSKQILELYMTTGGIPYYLSYIKKSLSVTQNIEALAFNDNGILFNEFDNLFSSLFDKHEIIVDMVRTIASHRYGIGQQELLKKMGKNMLGEVGLTKLKQLEDAGFIANFKPYSHKKRGTFYRVVDEYTLFYLKWIEPLKGTITKKTYKGYWNQQKQTASWYSWAGLTFETICYKHINQIQHALNLSPSALPYAWRHVSGKNDPGEGAQIDLLFDRDDDAITICEIKYSNKKFTLDKQSVKKLLLRKEIFVKQTKTDKQIFIVMITSNGLSNNFYADEIINGEITLDDLFLKDK